MIPEQPCDLDDQGRAQSPSRLPGMGKLGRLEARNDQDRRGRWVICLEEAKAARQVALPVPAAGFVLISTLLFLAAQ